jgi:hypothetical protein
MRYIVSDVPSESHDFQNGLYEHEFARGDGHKWVRFVFDTKNVELVAADWAEIVDTQPGEVPVGVEWTALDQSQGARLQAAIEDTAGTMGGYDWMELSGGLASSEELPDWAAPSASYSPAP